MCVISGCRDGSGVVTSATSVTVVTRGTAGRRLLLQKPFYRRFDFNRSNGYARFQLFEIPIFFKMVEVGEHGQKVLAFEQVVRILTGGLDKLHDIWILLKDAIQIVIVAELAASQYDFHFHDSHSFDIGKYDVIEERNR